MTANPAAAGDNELEVTDLGPLAWVLDELRKSLDGATKALRRFVRDAEMARGSDLTELDASHLRIARQQLHQAVGALEMVGLEVPAKILRAMESLAQKYVQRPELCSDDAAAKMERASFALTEYLEGVLKGKTSSSIALFPQYRAVMELTGAERVHPADLWPPEWRWVPVAIQSSVKPLAYEPDVRSKLDHAVLKVVKTGDTASAQKLSRICEALGAGQPEGHARSFWALCAGYFEAFALNLCAPDVYTKRIASRVLQQYASLARGQSDVSDRLAQDIVFFCSQAVPEEGVEAPLLRAVRGAYGLANAKAVDYETEQFGRFDPAQLALTRKRIAAAAETWSALAGGETNRMKVVSDQFGAVADSIVKLHPESGALAQSLQRAIEVTVRSGEAPVPAVAMEVATSVLYLEAAYEDLDPTDNHMADRGARLAQRLDHVCAGEPPEPMEGWMEDLYRRVSDRQTMGSVVDELRGSLNEVEKSLDQFFRNPTDKTILREVPTQLAQMRGVFSVLGLDQPSVAALRMRSSVEQFIVDDVDAESARTGVFEKLGNSLGAMGFLIDMLSYQRTLAKKLFVYDEAEGEFKPLMGRERQTVEPAVVPELPVPAPIAEVKAAPVAVEAKPVVPSVSAPVDEDDGSELLDIFLEEAREVIENGIAAIKALAVEPSNLADQTTLRRAFHTLKGSSRMVGLHDFGEAAWSFEQLLNAWLAEQRPASDELITVSGMAMRAFGRWSDDIASKADTPWDATDFRKTSDALRLERVLVPLKTPGQSEEETPEAPHVEDLVPAPQEPVVEPGAEFEVPDEIPSAPAEFASTQLASALDREISLHGPDFESTQLGADIAMDSAPAPIEFASTALASSLDLDSAPAKIDFASTQLVDSLNVLEEVESESVPLDFQPTTSFDFEKTAAFEAKTVEEPLVSSLGEFDFSGLDVEAEVPQEPEKPELAPAPEEPAVEYELDMPAEEPDVVVEAVETVEAEAEVEAQEQVKVIGSLRLSIPLYNVYLNEADEWSRRLQTELSEWALELEQDLPDSVVVLAHSLSGSSATVGFTALSELARSLEHALQHVQLHRQGTSQHAHVFNVAAEEVRRLLHQFAAGFLKECDAGIIEALQVIIDTEFAAPTLEEIAQDELEDLPESVADEVTVIEVDDMPEELPALEEEPLPEPVVALVVAPVPSVVSGPAEAVVAQAAPLRIVNVHADDIDAEDHLDEDLFPIFEEEAAELLPKLGAALRLWLDQPDKLSARSEVLRALHTLKGSARLAGAMRLGEMTHRMESSIEELGLEDLQVVQIEPLLGTFDTLQELFASLGQAPAEPAFAEPVSTEPVVAEPVVTGKLPDIKPVLTLVKTVAVAPQATPTPRAASNQSVRVRSQLLDRLVNQAGEVMITRSRMDSRMVQLRSSLEELDGNLDRLRKQLRDVELQAESQMQSRLAQTKDSAQSFDPLEFDRFTRVQELTRMMAESVNDVATVQRNLQRSIEGAEDDLIAQGRQARELQRDLLRTRMVEFEAISDRLYGVVRQAAKDAGKQVKLDIVGGSIEMDRGVLDRMAPAFEHILRNCVGHGIEDAAARAAAGKPAIGTITIAVNQESNDVSVAFSDDGGGLHLEKIRAKAIANGVIAADQVLSEADAANLIFSPGFSTAEKVTELSGRGVGMDVVRTEVNALGGRIETATATGKGSTFKLVLPLTTAVTQVVMLRMGEFSIGVPANLMETVLRVPLATLEQAYNGNAFDMGGQTLQFFWAGALLQTSQRSHEMHGKTQPVVVLRSAGQRMAIHVDEVLGNREVVVKNLGPQLARLPGLAGMSVLASGAVVLIYNPVALATVYGEQARVASEAAQSAKTPDVPGEAMIRSVVDEVPLVLVVDDSITVRRVTQRLLKREGYRVALAADGLQALERLAEEKPTVVLSDIEMPRMDGFDLARNIRGDDKLKDLPIIMITSRIAEKHREHARELGVDHYLGKPYSEDELMALVRSYCTTPSEI